MARGVWQQRCGSSGRWQQLGGAAGDDQSGGRACVRAGAQTWRAHLRGRQRGRSERRRVDGGHSLNSHLYEDEVINVEDGDRCVRVQCSRLVCSTGLVGAWLNPIRLSLWVFV